MSTAQRSRSAADTTQGEGYLGYWRLGGDNLAGWPGQPSTRNFIGGVDEVAIYPTALTAAQIQALVRGPQRRWGPNQPPQAAFTLDHAGLTASFDARRRATRTARSPRTRGPSVTDERARGATPSHPYARPGPIR